MRRQSDWRLAVDERWSTAIQRWLVPVFQGSREGQRRAVLLFLIWLAPMGLVATIILSADRSAVRAALRAVAIGGAIAWFWIRREASNLEWSALITVLVLANTAAQVAGGPTHSGVAAVNGLAAFSLASVVFDLGLVVYTAVLLTACYAGVQ